MTFHGGFIQLLFRQRLFSWFDSYDIFDESGQVLFVVKGQLSWGHKLNVYSADGQFLACLQEKILTFLPKFELWINNTYQGTLEKQLSFFKPIFTLPEKGWTVGGDIWGWNYQTTDSSGNLIMTANKDIWNFTDVYCITVENFNDALTSLLLVLAIDAEKCND